MLNLNNVLQLSATQTQIINSFGTLTADHWGRNKARLQDAIRDSLKTMQNKRCVYCGCRVWGTGDVEHIAHKAKYGQFVFTPENLAYACKNCNQTYKGQTDVVVHVDANYKLCRFTIVHPYLDDVDHFFDTQHPIIQIRDNLSIEEETKAKTTRKLFRWEDPEVTEQRAQLAMSQQYAVEHNASINQVLYENALTFNPGII